MYRALLADARFHELLLAFDRDLAAAARAGGCVRCGGVLHSARFLRKPRGGPAGLGEEHARRFSFCCPEDPCRKRATPPSFRFLGRKAYLGAVAVLVAAMRQGDWRPKNGSQARARSGQRSGSHATESGKSP